MLIEWDSGERITTSVALQERILTRMEKDANAPAERKGAASPVWVEKSFAGLQHGDFKGRGTGAGNLVRAAGFEPATPSV